MHWMNSGEGAHLRHQDYMLQTGQWVPTSPGKATETLEEIRRREAEARQMRSDFLDAMDALGNPGSQGFPRYPDLTHAVACWKVAETTERRPDVTEAEYQKPWFLTSEDELCYLDHVSTKRRFRRAETIKVLRSSSRWTGITPMQIADACRKIADKQGVKVPHS